MVLEAKYGQHLPLNRQSETYARERMELSVSTLADWVAPPRPCSRRSTPSSGPMSWTPSACYGLKRWVAFTGFLDDGRICLTNNAAERALRGVALGRKAWLFAGSDRGGERAATILSLITTAKLGRVPGGGVGGGCPSEGRSPRWFSIGFGC